MSNPTPPARKAERLNIWLAPLLVRQLKELAQAEDRTLRSLVEEAVRNFLKKETRK